MFGLFTFVATAFIALTFIVIPSAAHAERRVALVIGNGAYINAPPLSNPASDATDMAQVLRKIGFDVVDGIDLDKRSMEAKILEFGSKLQNADVALFFYAGHSLQVAGRNYLIPVDARLEGPAHLSFETFELHQVQDLMEAQRRVNLLFLDACRNNPFARAIAAASDNRSVVIGRGLGPAEAAAGILIAYATQPGNVAEDGAGQRNSPFTMALLKHIVTPGLEIRSVLIRVRADVMAATQDQQVPWDHSSLVRDVILVPAASGPRISVAAPAVTQPIYSPSAVDPSAGADSIGTVRAFYAAISQADGFAAAALMVPEKRGRHNFDPTEMTKFWSSVRQRLRVQSIVALGDDIVAVTYRFVDPTGKTCNTTATVRTIRNGGRTLIQSISAAC